MGAIELVEKSQLTERPAMKSGDTVRVHVKVREGDKERIQIFEGVVIGMHRGGTRASFTVRKVSFGQGVERIFPLHSPTIQKVEVMRSAKVRRAKLYYLRDLKGKAARMKDVVEAEGEDRQAGRQAEADRSARSACQPSALWSAFPPCARSRTRCAASGSCTSPASTKSGAAVWPARSWRPPSCCIPTGTSPASPIRRLVPAAERERLYDRIVRHAVAWAVASADPTEIDRINIHQASLRAMQRAVLALAPLPDIVLVDAFRVPELPMAQRGVPHGDRRCAAIAAASIVAKVTRDRQMLRAARPRSALRLRSPQGLRDGRSPRRRRAVRLLRRASPLVPAADAV